MGGGEYTFFLGGGGTGGWGGQRGGGTGGGVGRGKRGLQRGSGDLWFQRDCARGPAILLPYNITVLVPQESVYDTVLRAPGGKRLNKYLL